MGLKKLVVDALALGPTSRGFTGGEARRWVRESYRHRTRDYGFSKKETRWALTNVLKICKISLLKRKK